MGFKPGNKLARSRKGKPNKRTQALMELYESKGIFVPDRVEECINKMMNDYDDAQKPESRAMIMNMIAHIYLDLMQYLYPKRKAIEIDITNIFEQNMIVRVGWEDENVAVQPQLANEAKNASANQISQLPEKI